MQNKISTAVLGATGAVGQRFIQLLDGHPWFEVVALTGSQARVGKKFKNECNWVLSDPMPSWAEKMEIQPSDPAVLDVPLVFSALPSRYAEELEPRFARNGQFVCSNAGAFRTDPTVPVLLPEINPDHLQLLSQQMAVHSWSGGIVCNPNCTSTGMTIVLGILDKVYGVRKVIGTSLQAVSGAGYPGVSSLDIMENVIPNIVGEETKVESEPKKMMGKIRDNGLEPHPAIFSMHTNRVPVRDGHMVCISVELDEQPTLAAVELRLQSYLPPPPADELPSTPNPVILISQRDDRPQPVKDRMNGNGMTTTVGRVRVDPIFTIKMVVLSHNTIRGAAGGSIYNAELLVQQGFLG